MNRALTIFLQIAVVIFGIGALALILWEPRIEGRNVHSTLFEIYFKDPFLACAYMASLPFFVALYQAFKLLAYIGQNKAFSLNSVRTLRTIEYCAICIIGFILAAEGYLVIVRPGDDIAGGVALGLLMLFFSSVITATAALFERIFQSAGDLKSNIGF